MSRMWRPEPIWDRLHRMSSYGPFLRTCSNNRICISTNRAEDGRWFTKVCTYEVRGGYAWETIICEGYGSHVLGSMRAAIANDPRPVPLIVRLRLLKVLVDYLADEL